MDKPQIVLPGDFYNTLRDCAHRHGNQIGDGAWLRADGVTPHCIYGHADVAFGEHSVQWSDTLYKAGWDSTKNDDLIAEAGHDLTFEEYVERANIVPDYAL